ncbi:response regulator transcription factor [Streptomyces sp. C]|uniref:response regulator n=1 Tax=Streptomyces sp. C TaxID=253839 RepID=UPI0001B517DE|nr:response regulator transcription factor [Streptomyces sp. C]EFL20096.1 regulatory protein [Streptomyces sp. C]
MITAEQSTVEVLIADDDPLVRMGLSVMLGGAPDLRIVAEAGDGAEAVELARRHRPDVVLMDVRMPVMDGLAATRAVRAMSDAPEVLVLTTFDADAYVLRALRAGAAGFALKDTPPAELVEAVRRAAHGEPVLSPAVMRRLIDKVVALPEDGRGQDAGERLAVLNERERAVALGIGQGKSNAEIGAALYLGVSTVKTHVSAILAKLGLNNRVQIALFVHDAGNPEDRYRS